MKVKDMGEFQLLGTKIKIPKKYQDSYVGIQKEMYLYSLWGQGLWLKKSMEDTQVFPLSIDPKEVLNFTIVKKPSR